MAAGKVKSTSGPANVRDRIATGTDWRPWRCRRVRERDIVEGESRREGSDIGVRIVALAWIGNVEVSRAAAQAGLSVLGHAIGETQPGSKGFSRDSAPASGQPLSGFSPP